MERVSKFRGLESCWRSSPSCSSFRRGSDALCVRRWGGGGGYHTAVLFMRQRLALTAVACCMPCCLCMMYAMPSMWIYACITHWSVFTCCLPALACLGLSPPGCSPSRHQRHTPAARAFARRCHADVACTAATDSMHPPCAHAVGHLPHASCISSTANRSSYVQARRCLPAACLITMEGHLANSWCMRITHVSVEWTNQAGTVCARLP